MTEQARKATQFVSDHPAATRDLVAANRILYAKNVVDGFGHVSLRHPGRDNTFLIARSMAPAQVTADDLQIVDFDGEVLDDARKSYLERFIHAEIYRRHPGINAVVHCHSETVIPFGISQSASLRAVYHMSSFIGEDTPVFDIRDVLGDGSDMLVRESLSAKALADCFAKASVVLMRGHGATIVGETLPKAVFRAVYTEINARIQLQSMALQPLTFLSAGETAAATPVNEANIVKAWDLWVDETAG